jgi:hypothetical protein
MQESREGEVTSSNPIGRETRKFGGDGQTLADGSLPQLKKFLFFEFFSIHNLPSAQ